MNKQFINLDIKKYIKIAFLRIKNAIKYFIGCLIIGAILVFALRTVPDWLITNVKPHKLNEDQAITYFCTIIASFVTIVGILLTLDHNQKMVKDQLQQNNDKFSEERRLSILPIITIEELFCDIEQNDENDEFSQELIVYFENGSINYLPRLTDKYTAVINSLTEIREEEEGFFVVKQKGFFRQFSFTNSGIGTAVNLIVSFYGYYDGTKVTLNNYPIVNLKPMQSIKFIIFADEIVLLQDKYLIEFSYKDIYANKYEQEHEFEIFKLSNMTGMNFEVNQQLK